MVSLLSLTINHCDLLPFGSQAHHHSWCQDHPALTIAIVLTACRCAQLEALLSPIPVHEK